ncbi:MAG TPA: transcriptional regulator [Candidatus Methanoperedenaceae archaeon]|nr:transcriptional regulator [Candidatus Methanoperedenaceae archaeon]
MIAMDELIGFVTANTARKKVITLLGSKGAMEKQQLVKTLHLVGADKTLSELAEKGLITTGEKLSLTELGTAVERRVLAVR